MYVITNLLSNMLWMCDPGARGALPWSLALGGPIERKEVNDIMALSHASLPSTLPPNPRWILEPTQQKGHPSWRTTGRFLGLASCGYEQFEPGGTDLPQEVKFQLIGHGSAPRRQS
jgi:hypothetical protein